MAKFPEAEGRLFKSIFVVRRCKAKIRAPVLKVMAGRVKCRKCNYTVLRPIKKK